MTRPPRRQSKLTDEHPTWPSRVPDPEEAVEPTPLPTAPAPTGPAQSAPATDAPMPAPRRRRTTREQLNTRINTDLHARLQRFVTAHDAAVQDVVETALSEYLERRGH